MEITINGAQILYTIPLFGGIPITETMVNITGVTIVLLVVSYLLGRNLQVHAKTKRQLVAELLVQTGKNFVAQNMGEKFAHYVPFVAALFATSALSSLSSLTGLYPPTSDLSTTMAWAILVFVLITITKVRTNGVGGYALSFTKPIAVLTPFNLLSELSTPVSMAFRHYGNIVSGSVITTLIYAALAVASSALFGLLPGVLGEVIAGIPLLQVGVPAVLSVYFDVFSSFMQAFIFCMLTTLYIANAAATD